jgi:hypothetical protein
MWVFFAAVQLATIVWVAIDADKRDWSNDRFANHPWKWVVGCVFLWIVAFPAYLIRRGNAPLTP